jgi:hypothetical protein
MRGLVAAAGVAPRGGLSELGRVAAPCNSRAKRVFVDISMPISIYINEEGHQPISRHGRRGRGSMSHTKRERERASGALSKRHLYEHICRLETVVWLQHLWMLREPCMRQAAAAPHEMGKAGRQAGRPAEHSTPSILLFVVCVCRFSVSGGRDDGAHKKQQQQQQQQQPCVCDFGGKGAGWWAPMCPFFLSQRCCRPGALYSRGIWVGGRFWC